MGLIRRKDRGNPWGYVTEMQTGGGWGSSYPIWLPASWIRSGIKGGEDLGGQLAYAACAEGQNEVALLGFGAGLLLARMLRR